ncbi:uncharacterized protein [Rutidosis leptorrhynchoides]|uniref:uncharacterized protein n=1 Tax=Rutidosis leptorrhynchoides TaxID=125765 RepID=UPI003A99B9DF
MGHRSSRSTHQGPRRLQMVGSCDRLLHKVDRSKTTKHHDWKHIEKFIWKHIVCRFRIPQEIVSDNGKQFAEGNGQVEVTNRDILKGLEKRLGKCHQGWMEELPLVLWAHRTTPKRSNRETPYSLVYSTEAVLPAEIQVLTNRTANLEENVENLRLNLDLMDERREAAPIQEAAYKKMIEKYYNK